jgi:hypothetical protein
VLSSSGSPVAFNRREESVAQISKKGKRSKNSIPAIDPKLRAKARAPPKQRMNAEEIQMKKCQ